MQFDYMSPFNAYICHAAKSSKYKTKLLQISTNKEVLKTWKLW